MVLSQPQEIVSIATGYHGNQQNGREEIVYDNDLLHTDLDHEEIANSISQHELTVQNIAQQEISEQASLSQSSSSQTDKNVVMDPMMETDDENEDEEGHCGMGSRDGSPDRLVIASFMSPKAE